MVKFQHMVNALIFLTPLINRAGIHKMLVTTANKEDPDQTASEEAV